jgi:hypothetical protein
MGPMAQTSLLCHHAEHWCTKPATHTCVLCAGRFCGKHILRASFTGPGRMLAPDVYDLCPQCVGLAIRQDRILGLTLSQWRKVS